MDREKVIKGLKYLHDVKHWSPDESEESITARRNITGDAIALLKAQEPEALDAQKQDSDVGCWYDITHNYTLEQVVSALKAQEPHLLTLDEFHDSMVVYLEAGEKFLKIVDDDGVVLAIGGSERAGAKCFITVWDVGIAAMDDEYNVTWRAWSERPTKEQREGTPWRT